MKHSLIEIDMEGFLEGSKDDSVRNFSDIDQDLRVLHNIKL